MPQRRQRRLYALTCSTSLTLASLTNKELSNPLCHINSTSLEDILLIALLSIIFAGVPVISGPYLVRR